MGNIRTLAQGVRYEGRVEIMDLYSSLGLVAAMALSALVAVWLLYKRSRRDEFPEETWDP